MESVKKFFSVVWFYVCVCFKKYADFKSRARRKEYWSFAIFIFLVGRFLELAFNLTGFEFLIYLSVVYNAATIVPLWAVVFRRLHDIGYSGWVAVIAFVLFTLFTMLGAFCIYYQYEALGCAICLFAIVAFTVLYFYYFLKDSQSGENKWGANPKELEN